MLNKQKLKQKIEDIRKRMPYSCFDNYGDSIIIAVFQELLDCLDEPEQIPSTDIVSETEEKDTKPSKPEEEPDALLAVYMKGVQDGKTVKAKQEDTTPTKTECECGIRYCMCQITCPHVFIKTPNVPPCERHGYWCHVCYTYCPKCKPTPPDKDLVMVEEDETHPGYFIAHIPGNSPDNSVTFNLSRPEAKQLQQKLNSMFHPNLATAMEALEGALPIVLDFVERYNKQDKEGIVAEAASDLNELLAALTEEGDENA